VSNVVVEIVKTMGKALIAGVGVELARVAGQHLSKRLGPKQKPKDEEPKETETLKQENERLRSEVQKLKDELQAVKTPEPL
jgi:cell division protein FtsB